jgi:4-coumarate--CoA ligase
VVAHHLDRLRAEVLFWADLLAPVRRIIALVPAHHIYGFIFTVLLPQALGCPGVRQNEALGALQAGVGPGDLVVGLPEWWHYLVASGAALGGSTLISSTAPCPEHLRRGVMAAGAGSLMEVYGSTETAAIGYRFEDQQAYTLLPLWRRDGQDHGLHDAAPIEGAPAEASLQDHLTWLADDRFVVGERLDGCLPIAGSKVNPAVVVACLASHPMVARCTVQAVETPAGMRLAAEVVPSAAAHGLEAHAIEARLAAFCQSQLPAAAQPAQWIVGVTPNTAPNG